MREPKQGGLRVGTLQRARKCWAGEAERAGCGAELGGNGRAGWLERSVRRRHLEMIKGGSGLRLHAARDGVCFAEPSPLESHTLVPGARGSARGGALGQLLLAMLRVGCDLCHSPGLPPLPFPHLFFIQGLIYIGKHILISNQRKSPR